MRIHAISSAAQPRIAPEPPPARDVPPRRTPMSVEAIRREIAGAWRKQTGHAPSPELVDVLSAQVRHETAHGERMFNYNFGGIKGRSPAGMTARYTTREVLDGKEKKLVDGFRAYASAADGASDYLTLMRTRYGAALPHAERGDVDGFVSELKRMRYFTADEGAYAASLRGVMAAPGSPATSGTEQASTATREPSEIGAPAGFSFADLPTAVAVARVLDAVGAAVARLGAPDRDEG